MRLFITLFLILCSLFVNAQTTNIYQPPYKLMQQAAAQKQAQYDAFFNKYYDFVNSININHLDAEDENYNAKELERYFKESAFNIKKALENNPSKTIGYTNLLNNLISEYIGNQSRRNILQSFNLRNKFFDDFKSLRESDPDKFLKMLKDLDDKWGGNSEVRIWSAY